MASDSEPAKLLLPFLQRADELQKHEPLVAYYCRLFAMDRGLRIPQKDRTKTTNALLVSLMNQLEKDKKSLKLGPEDSLYIEGFGSSIFAKADKQDRAGRADLITAKTFYAASIFLEVLTQFGELAPDIEQKLKYAVWKAADIRKALKEGRIPEAGPPGGDEELFVPLSSQTNTKVPDSNENNQNKSSSELSLNQEQDLGRESLYYPRANSPSQSLHKDLGNSESFNNSEANISSQFAPKINPHATQQPGTSFVDHQQPPQPSSQNYHHPYSYEQPPFAPNFSPENLNPSFYPNFQSYPSFQESSFPSAPTSQPSHYHGTDIPHSLESTAQYITPMSNGNLAGPSFPPAASYEYNSGYQPNIEKIAEAHKAARFAVGALAFDDVPVAVEFLRKSLELLTNPYAETH